MQMQKATLTKKQAEALEYIRRQYYADDSLNEKLLQAHLNGYDFTTETSTNWGANAKPLNYLSLDTLIRALYIGYEIEKTPEDILVRRFNDTVLEENNPNNLVTRQQWWEGYRTAMIDTLNTLGTKIKGVND